VTTAAPREALRQYIASPRTRSALHAYARRRGLHESADDVVQTVLCDALAAPAIPVEGEELPRWLNGIASHKVADEHRRRARWSGCEPPEASAEDSDEARDLLRRIEGEVASPEERQALEWLVREHRGEALCEMARAEALAPDTLRQRVARFRRKLRARYLAPLAFLLALGTGTVFELQRTGTVLATGSQGLAAFAGEWRIVDVAPARYRGLARSVHIGGDGVSVSDGLIGHAVQVERINDTSVRVRSADRTWLCQIERRDADHFRLVSERGFVALERYK
jgi:DNA-directed RNA polymerase specialized sigma24 family protein